jgi:glycerophosphoryl diester phosphodiesterase
MRTQQSQRHQRAAVAAAVVAATACGTIVACGPAGARATGAQSVAAASYGRVSAHRGGDYGIDNSLKAFKGALSHGVKDIEGDVYFTTDHVGVMHHDNSLSNCHSSRTITGSTWAQVSKLRCADGARPAKLADVLRAFQASSNTSAVFRVEVKHHGESATAQQAAAKLLVQRLQEKKMTGRAIVQDFSWRTTAGTIHATQPGIRVSCLETDMKLSEVSTAKAKGCYDVSYNAANWHKGLDEAVHKAGMQAAVWTVDNKATFDKFRDAYHANVIITNVPSQALHW